MNVSQGEEMELLPYEQAAAALMGRENARFYCPGTGCRKGG